jgi:chemotaxis-related protein WspB
MSAMLFLKFRIGSESYALDAAQIAEVLPLVQITRVPQAPIGVAGLINYRGRFVPVVDLSELMFGEPARPHISTRLILVRYGEHLLGLIAEQATETMRREAASFADSGIANDAAPYLGPVTHDGGQLIRWLEVQKLLPAAVSSVLFRRAEENAWSTPESPRC